MCRSPQGETWRAGTSVPRPPIGIGISPDAQCYPQFLILLDFTRKDEVACTVVLYLDPSREQKE